MASWVGNGRVRTWLCAPGVAVFRRWGRRVNGWDFRRFPYYNKTQQPVAQTDTGDEPCWICSASMQRRKVEQISRKRRKQTLIIDSLLIGLLIPR